MANRNLGGSGNYYSYSEITNRSGGVDLRVPVSRTIGHYEGRLLRLKQQYFPLLCGGLQSILAGTYDKLNLEDLIICRIRLQFILMDTHHNACHIQS